VTSEAGSLLYSYSILFYGSDGNYYVFDPDEEVEH
jgi:hypothetical protein